MGKGVFVSVLSCVLWLHCGNLLVLGGLFDGSLLTDDLLQPLQPDVLSAQVTNACLTAMQQRQGVDVFQLRVADALVHHQVQQLVCSVVQHLIVLPGKIEVSLPRHGDVGEVLLEDEDVSAHLLYTRLTDPLKVLSPID